MNGPYRDQNDAALTIFKTGCSIGKFKPRGVSHNICLSLEEERLHIETGNPFYFGETIGRVANRISRATLKDVNGRDYQLPANGDQGQNCLHGGERGWGKKQWQSSTSTERRDSREVMRTAQKYTYLSPDGDEGFPGNVEARAFYSVWEEGDKTILELEYEAEMLPEQPDGVEETVVAMTNHAFFNLNDDTEPFDATVGGSVFRLHSTDHLELDPRDNIPTGRTIKLERDSMIPEDEEFVVGTHIPILDHCFVLSPPGNVPLDTRSRPLQLCASLMHPKTAVYLEVLTTEPAFQCYTGDGISINTGNIQWGPRSGIAIEPSRYINAANRPEWKHMVLLKKGQIWGSRIRYETWVEPEEISKA